MGVNDWYDNTVMYLKENKITTLDVLVQLGFNGYENFDFFGIASSQTNRDLRANEFYKNKNILYSCQMFLNPMISEHSRTIYGVIDFLGDIGGILGIITSIFGFFICPYSEFDFFINASKKIWKPRLEDQKYFNGK